MRQLFLYANSNMVDFQAATTQKEEKAKKRKDKLFQYFFKIFPTYTVNTI